MFCSLAALATPGSLGDRPEYGTFVGLRMIMDDDLCISLQGNAWQNTIYIYVYNCIYSIRNIEQQLRNALRIALCTPDVIFFARGLLLSKTQQFIPACLLSFYLVPGWAQSLPMGAHFKTVPTVDHRDKHSEMLETANHDPSMADIFVCWPILDQLWYWLSKSKGHGNGCLGPHFVHVDHLLCFYKPEYTESGATPD